MLRFRLLGAVALAVALLVPAAAGAQNRGIQNSRPVPLSAQAVLLLDANGRTVFAKNADDERAPASLVKMMTLYLAHEAIAAGQASLDDEVTVSWNAASTPRYRIGLRPGEQAPLRVLMEGVAIASANDAATAVAEHVAGDEAAFVARMNDRARMLGLVSTRFANPHGLPDPEQRTTARDMALLTARLIHDYPASRHLLGSQTFVFRGRVHARHISLFQDPGGVQALKTGYTKEAGYNLAVSAWRDGLHFVMVVLGARTRTTSFLDGKRLLQHGFAEAGLLKPAVEPSPKAIQKKSVRVRRAKQR